MAGAAERVREAEQATRAAQEAVQVAEERARHANPFNRSGRERDLAAARHTLWDARQAETGQRARHAEATQSAQRRQEAARRMSDEVRIAEGQLGWLRDDRHQLSLKMMPLPGVEYQQTYSRADLEALRDGWLAEPQPRETADPARAIIDLINDERQLADLTTPSQWHTLADATNPDDLVWHDSDKRWLWGLRRPLLSWLGQQADRLAGNAQWHDGAEALTSRWATIEQDAETAMPSSSPGRPLRCASIPIANPHDSAHPDTTSAPAGDPLWTSRPPRWRQVSGLARPRE